MIMKKQLTPKQKNILFWICAAAPFLIADIFLRYVIYFMPTYQIWTMLFPILYNTFWIGLILIITIVLLPKTIGRIIYGILSLIIGVWFFANYCYYSIFNQYLWIRHISMAGEGSDYFSVVLSHIGPGTIFVALLYLGVTVLTIVWWQRPNNLKIVRRFLLCGVAIFGIVVTELLMQLHAVWDKSKGAWEVWEKPALVYDLFSDSTKSLCSVGLYQFTAKSLYYTVFPQTTYTEEEIAKIDQYFASKPAWEDNEMAGILEGKNVIFVMMESMDDWLIDETYTPTISYMMENGINFTQHYMSNRGTGYTFNAEFAANVGYYCPSDVSSTSIYTANSFPQAIGNKFQDAGYHCQSVHFNSKSFYNRAAMHNQFGYSEYYCLQDYLSREKSVIDSEAASSEEVYSIMTEEEPFMTFFITYSPHFPYKTDDAKTKTVIEKYPELMDESMDEETRNLRLLAHDTDEFFRILLEQLEEEGKLKDTVIVAFSDHYAYGMNNKEALGEYTIEAGSEIKEKVPFFIYSPGIEPVTVEKVTSAIDIAPTLVNLFGLEKTPYYMGYDAFDPNHPGLVYFASYSWYDGTIHYRPGATTPSTPEEKERIERINQYVQNQTYINDLVIHSDYFSNMQK